MLHLPNFCIFAIKEKTEYVTPELDQFIYNLLAKYFKKLNIYNHEARIHSVRSKQEITYEELSIGECLNYVSNCSISRTYAF